MTNLGYVGTSNDGAFSAKDAVIFTTAIAPSKIIILWERL